MIQTYCDRCNEQILVAARADYLVETLRVIGIDEVEDLCGACVKSFSKTAKPWFDKVKERKRRETEDDR